MNQPEIEYRAARQLDVSFPHRTVELVVMPYEEETMVAHQGRMIREIVSRGAFDGIDTRPNRVKANRDHNITRVCGKAVRFHPSRDEGLVAEIRMAKTPLGEETLELCAEGILDASAGFTPLIDPTTGEIVAGAEAWPSRDLRRLNRIWLHHIAMTPDPAYESAQVLAVRQAASERHDGASREQTPNLDYVRGLIRSEEYARLSR